MWGEIKAARTEVKVKKFQRSTDSVSSKRDIRETGEEDDVVGILKNLDIRMEVVSDFSEVDIEEEWIKDTALGNTFMRNKRFQQSAIADWEDLTLV